MPRPLRRRRRSPVELPGGPHDDIEALARAIAPHLAVVSVSNPTPVLRRFNVVAALDDEERARDLVVALEGDIEDDAGIGVVVLSADPTADVGEEQVDPERVTGFVARRVLIGGTIGAATGAVLIGGTTALVTSGTAPVVTAAVAGALFGAVPGATYRTFADLGGSDAYRQTFVSPEVASVVLVSVHADEEQHMARHRERLAEHAPDRVFVVDRDGREVT